MSSSVRANGKSRISSTAILHFAARRLNPAPGAQLGRWRRKGSISTRKAPGTKHSLKTAEPFLATSTYASSLPETSKPYEIRMVVAAVVLLLSRGCCKKERAGMGAWVLKSMKTYKLMWSKNELGSSITDRMNFATACS